MGCGWPMMTAMLVVWTLITGGVVAGAIFLVRALRDGGADADGRARRAMVILEERYARGELDEEEFFRRRRALVAGR